MGGGVKWRQVEGTGEGSGAVHRHLRPLPGPQGPGDPPAQVPGRAGAGHGDHQGRRQRAVPVRVPPGRVRGLRGQAPQPAPDRPPDPRLRPHVRGRGGAPQPLREYAGLTKDVVLLGQIRRVEIWDKAEWERYRAVAEAAYADETTPPPLPDLGV